MITATKLSGKPLVINAALIETVAQTPDTVITLVTGNKYVVTESVDHITEAVIAYGKRIGWGGLQTCKYTKEGTQ